MGKSIYSIFYYISAILIFFTRIRPSKHYLDEHEREVPWHEVIEVILTTKDPRKRHGCYQVENDRYYILFRIKDGELVVINAKRK